MSERLLVSVASDLLSLLFPGVPTATFGNAVGALLKRRLVNAQEILIEELRDGRPGELVSDDKVAILFRYARAAQEGAACVNLRILARVIAGSPGAPPLSADRFLHLAGLIESLRYEEIILLGCLYRHWREDRSTDCDSGSVQKGVPGVIKEMVPSIYTNNQAVAAAMAGVSRTGLLAPVLLISGLTYTVSPLLEELMKLASLEAALEKEGAQVA